MILCFQNFKNILTIFILKLLKDEDKFLKTKAKLKIYLENNIIEVYSKTSKYNNFNN